MRRRRNAKNESHRRAKSRIIPPHAANNGGARPDDMTDLNLNEQSALVTGASRGIGRAIAEQLGRAGARVIGTATTAAGARDLEQRLQDAGIDGRGHTLDAGSAESVEQLGAWLAENGPAPSILVNNAGVSRDNLVMRMKQEEWDEVINTNLNSVYRLSRLCLRAMMKARWGRIINIASVVALSGNPGQANYTAAKAGMMGFTRSLAREVGGRGVTVNCIAPGFIETDMTAALPAEQREKMLEHIPLGRFGAAADVAPAAVFLASAAGGYITGEVFNINGGLFMG